jgi:hypothetical protein
VNPTGKFQGGIGVKHRRWLLLAAALLAGCGAPDYRPNDRTQPVGRAAYGRDWPFAIERGELDCVTPAQVILRSGGRAYALNGTAEATGKYRPLAEILPGGKDTKPHLTRLIDDGLRLCND